MNPRPPSPPDTCAQGHRVADAPDPIASLRERLAAIYTPLETAVEELHKRRRRFAGRTPGHDWLPPGYPADQRAGAFLFRFIATPCFETTRFLELATECDLLPVIGEYHRDCYAPCNPVKRALGVLSFANIHETANHHSPLVEHVKIVGRHPNSQPLCDMRTKWKQRLVEFHHEMLAGTLNGGGHPLLAEYSQHYADAGGKS